MKLYTIDKDYFDYIYNKVDKQVLFSHTDENGRGRANVWVRRAEYKGQYQDFAIPEKGDVSFSEKDKNIIRLNSSKSYGLFTSGFMVNKLMPIEISLLKPFTFSRDSDFRQIATEITRKEPELIENTKQHLKLLESGAKELFSTNVDKQLKFLNARAELLNQGIPQEQIYNSSFECNVLRAQAFRAKEHQVSKQEIKPKVKEFEIE